ncbi:MAG TPA: hypothetical protein VMU54_20485 [Planctomycetota bacterium]|nr:hypothetical protein [Planctomycetota bacterium]
MGAPENPEMPPSASARKIRPDLWISLALLIGVLLLRMPTILWPHELNVDESQMMSQAMKYLVDPIPWRSVDGTSSGPLNTYPLTLLLLLGCQPGYVLLHAVAAVLVGLQLVLAHRTLLRLASGKAVLWALIPMLLALGLTRESELLFYASELLPSLLLAAGFHAFIIWMDGRCAAGARLLYLSGMLLGAAPWCKLQALPIAGALGMAVLVSVLKSNTWFETSSPPGRGALAFAAGAVTPAVLILSAVAGGGALGDFWSSYILGNLSYAGPLETTRFLGRLEELLDIHELWPFLTMLFVVGTLGVHRLMKGRPPISAREFVLAAIVALFALSALFAVCRPAYFFPHYAIFLIYPLTLLGSAPLLLSRPKPIAGVEPPAGALRSCAGALAAVLLAGVAGSRVLELRGRADPPPDCNEKIAAEILKIQKARPVRSLAIWGWTPGVHVLTGLPPATRDAIGHFVISRGSMQSYFRKRFVEDLRRAKPEVFIDTVVPGTLMWKWTENDGYESDEPLRRFIQEQYDPVLSLPLWVHGKPARVFVRREPGASR